MEQSTREPSAKLPPEPNFLGKKKRVRVVQVPAAVKHPTEPGFVCNYCSREKTFHSKIDTETHYSICKFGPVVARANVKLGYVCQSSTSYVCFHCGHKLKSINAIKYHMNTCSGRKAYIEEQLALTENLKGIFV